MARNDAKKIAKKTLKILSNRKSTKEVFWEVVFEWEDELQKYFNTSFVNYRLNTPTPTLCDKISKKTDDIRRKIRNFVYKDKETFFLQFDMDGFQSWQSNKSYIIPAIIDFIVKEKDLPLFYENYSRNPFVLVSSMEAFAYLKKNNCPLQIYHFPLSISDKYGLKYNNVRKFDCILAGRQEPKMQEWVETYAKEDPTFVYAFRKEGTFDYYTNKGDYVGKMKNREQFVNLISCAKVGLYINGGLDEESKKIANGFSWVTVRFFEYLVCGCHIIAKFEENEDTDYFQLSSMCCDTKDYTHFKEQMEKMRIENIDVVKYQNYLNKHYTSQRATLLENILLRYKEETAI